MNVLSVVATCPHDDGHYRTTIFPNKEFGVLYRRGTFGPEGTPPTKEVIKVDIGTAVQSQWQLMCWNALGAMTKKTRTYKWENDDQDLVLKCNGVTVAWITERVGHPHHPYRWRTFVGNQMRTGTMPTLMRAINTVKEIAWID